MNNIKNPHCDLLKSPINAKPRENSVLKPLRILEVAVNNTSAKDMLLFMIQIQKDEKSKL